MKAAKEPLTIEKIKSAHLRSRDEIRKRLDEFRAVGENGSDEQFWEEMVFCFFTGGCSARMGLNSVNAVRPLLRTGDQRELAAALTGVHRYPNARSAYIVYSRNFLSETYGMKIRERLASFADPHERRDWLVREKGIKGLGYKEASHFLRNVGYRGYAILDKHVLRSLAELGFIGDPKPPNTKLTYLRVEERFRDLTIQADINFDELDLVLWSMKTGVILK